MIHCTHAGHFSKKNTITFNFFYVDNPSANIFPPSTAVPNLFTPWTGVMLDNFFMDKGGHGQSHA